MAARAYPSSKDAVFVKGQRFEEYYCTIGFNSKDGVIPVCVFNQQENSQRIFKSSTVRQAWSLSCCRVLWDVANDISRVVILLWNSWRNARGMDNQGGNYGTVFTIDNPNIFWRWRSKSYSITCSAMLEYDLGKMEWNMRESQSIRVLPRRMPCHIEGKWERKSTLLTAHVKERSKTLRFALVVVV